MHAHTEGQRGPRVV